MVFLSCFWQNALKNYITFIKGYYKRFNKSLLFTYLLKTTLIKNRRKNPDPSNTSNKLLLFTYLLIKHKYFNINKKMVIQTTLRALIHKDINCRCLIRGQVSTPPLSIKINQVIVVKDSSVTDIIHSPNCFNNKGTFCSEDGHWSHQRPSCLVGICLNLVWIFTH